MTDYSSSSEESESSDEDGETDGTVAVSDIPRIMYVFAFMFPLSCSNMLVFVGLELAQCQ